jgi:hypothetical protein
MFKLIRRLIALAFLLAIGAVVLFFSLDRIAEAAIEKGGTYALGVETTLDEADVGVFSRTFGLKELRVANPEGFERTPFLELKSGETEVKVESLFKDTVDIPKLLLEGVRLRLEQQGGRMNYAVITDNLKRFESKSPSEKEGKKFIIREVLIRDVVCTVDLLPLGGALTTTDLKIPELRLTGVGTEGNKGVVLAELAGVIVSALFQAVADKGEGILPGNLTRDLGSRVGELLSLGGQGMKILDSMGGELKRFGKILDTFGGLLGGKK